MMDIINYKELDRKSLIKYLEDNREIVKVQDLMDNSGANPRRVFPLLCELTREGVIEVLEEDNLGAPEKIRLLKA